MVSLACVEDCSEGNLDLVTVRSQEVRGRTGAIVVGVFVAFVAFVADVRYKHCLVTTEDCIVISVFVARVQSHHLLLALVITPPASRRTCRFPE